MPVIAIGKVWHFCPLSIDLDQFPDLARKHRKLYPNTPAVEALGLKFARDGFPETGAINFVQKVCGWGGYAGIAGRVTRDARPLAICSALQAGYNLAIDGSPGEGLRAINGLKGLGISFASKHLRFLVPQSAVVLDSIISGRLGYSMSIDGYESFLADCQTLQADVERASIVHPFNADGHWRVSDIESAIFAKLGKPDVRP